MNSRGCLLSTYSRSPFPIFPLLSPQLLPSTKTLKTSQKIESFSSGKARKRLLQKKINCCLGILSFFSLLIFANYCVFERFGFFTGTYGYVMLLLPPS